MFCNCKSLKSSSDVWLKTVRASLWLNRSFVCLQFESVYEFLSQKHHKTHNCINTKHRVSGSTSRDSNSSSSNVVKKLKNSKINAFICLPNHIIKNSSAKLLFLLIFFSCSLFSALCNLLLLATSATTENFVWIIISS